MMLKSECEGDGPEAWKQLLPHFYSSETPRVMNLLEQLTSLSFKPSEEMTNYLIRAETLSSSMEIAGEKTSRKLIVSGFLKGYWIVFSTLRLFTFFRKPTPFCDLNNALKKVSDSQELKEASCEFSFIRGYGESTTRDLILDFGCSSHTFCDRDFLVKLKEDCWKICVNTSNSLYPARGRGVAKISLKDKKVFHMS